MRTSKRPESKDRPQQRHGHNLCSFHNLVVANGLLFICICALKVYLMISHPVLHGDKGTEDLHLYKASLMGEGSMNGRFPLQQQRQADIGFSRSTKREVDVKSMPQYRDFGHVGKEVGRGAGMEKKVEVSSTTNSGTETTHIYRNSQQKVEFSIIEAAKYSHR